MVNLSELLKHGLKFRETPYSPCKYDIFCNKKISHIEVKFDYLTVHHRCNSCENIIFHIYDNGIDTDGIWCNCLYLKYPTLLDKQNKPIRQIVPIICNDCFKKKYKSNRRKRWYE